MQEVYAPTVLPFSNFDPQKDCEVLRKAMKGLGTDEAALISVLCHRSWQQRCEIERVYQQLYGKDLTKEIHSETSGDFRRVLVRLLKTPIELSAYEMNEAVRGAGTDEECLVEIICTKPNDELDAIKFKYEEMFNEQLERAVADDTSGYFRQLLTSLLCCNRPMDRVDPKAAAADAEALFRAGQGRFGTDEARFNTILCSRSFAQLRAIFECYQIYFKYDIVDALTLEFSGDILVGLLAVVACIRSPINYLATRLHTALTGFGKDLVLLRIVVARCDFDLGAIKAEYERLYGTALSKAVHDKTSGDFKKSLLALIGD